MTDEEGKKAEELEAVVEETGDEIEAKVEKTGEETREVVREEVEGLGKELKRAFRKEVEGVVRVTVSEEVDGLKEDLGRRLDEVKDAASKSGGGGGSSLSSGWGAFWGCIIAAIAVAVTFIMIGGLDVAKKWMDAPERFEGAAENIDSAANKLLAGPEQKVEQPVSSQQEEQQPTSSDVAPQDEVVAAGLAKTRENLLVSISTLKELDKAILYLNVELEALQVREMREERAIKGFDVALKEGGSSGKAAFELRKEFNRLENSLNSTKVRISDVQQKIAGRENLKRQKENEIGLIRREILLKDDSLWSDGGEALVEIEGFLDFLEKAKGPPPDEPPEEQDPPKEDEGK